MKIRKSYKGLLNGVFGIWTDTIPNGLELQEEITFYVPDENKMFKKDKEYFDCVILKYDDKIEDYEEIDKPEETNL